VTAAAAVAVAETKKAVLFVKNNRPHPIYIMSGAVPYLTGSAPFRRKLMGNELQVAFWVKFKAENRHFMVPLAIKPLNN
jgi:hypothetical protein